jgi:DNA-directed RNA polymerase subunit H (RpoH/RPB5)
MASIMESEYPVVKVVNIINGAFFKYRDMTPSSRDGNKAPPVLTDDRIISDMEHFAYVRIDARRNAPRGDRSRVVFIILDPIGKYANHSPDLRKLLSGVESESVSKILLDEIIVVASDAFFKKKALTDVIISYQQKSVGGVDASGNSPFYSAHPFYNFVTVVPEHVRVPYHRIISSDEMHAIKAYGRISRSMLPVMLNIDAMAIWIGAREGDVVEIQRETNTGYMYAYRRVESVFGKLII